MKSDGERDTDAKYRIEWWQAITERDRAHWLKAAGSADPLQAWVEYKRQVGDEGIAVDRRRRRRAAVDTARASVGLEGFRIGPKAEDLAARFVAEEIDLDEFSAAIAALV